MRLWGYEVNKVMGLMGLMGFRGIKVKRLEVVL